MKKTNVGSVSKQQEALSLVESGRYDQARPILAELVRSNPDNVDARYLLGVCERSAGDIDLAEATFRVVISRIPQHHQALYGLGLILESKGNIPDAVEVWRMALKTNPNFDYATRKLAQYGVSVEQEAGKTRTSQHLGPDLDAKKRQWLEQVLPGIEIPTDLNYTDQHVWIRLDEGSGTVGITDFLRFTRNTVNAWIAELPKVGSEVAAGQTVCKIDALITVRGPKRLYPNPKNRPFKFTPTDLNELRHRSRKLIPVPSPVNGRIAAVNKHLVKRFLHAVWEWALVNDPYGKGWVYRIELNQTGWTDFEQLMDAGAYKQFVSSVLTNS